MMPAPEPMHRMSVDPVLVGTVLALVAIGAVMVSSASVGIAADQWNDEHHYLRQHLLALAIGSMGMFVALQTPVKYWNRTASLMLAGALILLVLVLIPGIAERTNGARRWIDLGPIGLQASELARLMLLIYLVSYAVRHYESLSAGVAGFVRPVAIVGLASLLMLMEPDFGTTVLLAATSLGILFLGGARLRDLAVTAALGGGACIGLIFKEPYRVDRVLNSWLNPFADQFDSGYQLVQSFIAIGSGTWLGAGLGQGVQKLHYLPEAHTDFIFAVLAEEFGLLGASLVIVLFSLLVYRAFNVGQRAMALGLRFHALLAMAIGLMLGMQAAISIGVNTGLLPTKGLTLPLISYGRTSLVVTLFALGILFRLAYEVAEASRQPRRAGGMQ